MRSRSSDVFDRHAWIDAVLVVEIDAVDAKPLETGLARLCDVFGSIHAKELTVRPAHTAELGRQHHFGSARLQYFRQRRRRTSIFRRLCKAQFLLRVWRATAAWSHYVRSRLHRLR
jgi:hypothetical protein